MLLYQLRKIDKILDQSIRPHLQMDGGDIELITLEENILTLRYLGACGGCPSASGGTLRVIENHLKSQLASNIKVHTYT